jgi:hypothetical protein
MKNSMKSMMITAAVSGLLGGTAARLQATPVATATSSQITASTATGDVTAGKISFASAAAVDGDKHSCKGKNDCKGQGGCKTGDNGCKAKNSCKGKGGCATDGSKAPQAA